MPKELHSVCSCDFHMVLICRLKGLSPRLAIAAVVLVICIISFFYSVGFTNSSYNVEVCILFISYSSPLVLLINITMEVFILLN